MVVAEKRAGRPKNAEQSVILEISGVEPKLIEYLETLRMMQGFGASHSAIARNFIWAEINRLIEAGRLQQR